MHPVLFRIGTFEVGTYGVILALGFLAALAAFIWRSRKLGLRFGITGDALVPATALGQALGRLGCFSAGCCYGTVCDKPWAVTFTNADAARFSGTPLYEHLHPVQLYTFAGNLVVMGLLLALRPKRRFEGQVLAAYFVLEGIARAVVETWRGDLDRGTWFGLAWLSTGRLTALAFVAIGVVIAVVMGRRAPAKAA